MPEDPKPEDWGILGVEPGCSRAEARAGYLARATALHPDHHPDVDDDERARLVRAMAAVNAAWDRLEARDRWDAPPPRDAPAPGAPPRRAPDPAAPTRLPEPPPGFVRARTFRGLSLGDQLVLIGDSRDLLTLARTHRGLPYTLLSCDNRRIRVDHLAAVLDALPELRHLHLEGSGVGDETVALLATRPGLIDVRLGDTAVTDAALPSLAALRCLQVLYLSYTAVSDAGVAHLRAHPRLAVLNLRGTTVTGVGLDAVGSCPSLRLVALPDVSRAERMGLQTRRPDVLLT